MIIQAREKERQRGKESRSGDASKRGRKGAEEKQEEAAEVGRNDEW